MIVNGNRALAYIAKVTNIEPIVNCDNIVHATVNDGWKVIINKNDGINVGDEVVYFEVDSRVNSNDERFAFLEKKQYRIKTMKMRGVYSQGLVMPKNLFPEIESAKLGDDVTEKLKVTYYEAEDNVRKAKTAKDAKYASMAARHKKLMQNKFIRWLMRREWGRKILFVFLGNKKDSPREFPSFIKKTDEERIENQPWRLGDGKTYILTEKLDGTSSTYALKRTKKKNKFEFYVCSRNVRQKDEKQECYHDTNVYWDMAFKYNIENCLKDWLENHEEDDWVCIQGETVGNVQGNPLKLKENDLYVFNFITSSNARYDSYTAREIVNGYWMKFVPILGTDTLPDTMEEMKERAEGNSVVNPNVLREGVVYRSLDGKDSFKNVARSYLLKHNQ